MTQSSSEPDTTAADGDGHSAEEAPLDQLGRMLQQAREARGLSREALASQLNMGLEQLEALETADRSRLPETVFIVAQARRVASQLQLNIDGPIQALRRAMPAGGRPAGRSAVELPLAGPPKAPARAARPPVAAPQASTPGGPSPLAALGRAVAWLALLAGLGSAATLGWNRWQQTQRPAPAASPPAAPPAATPPVASAPPATATAEPAAAADQLVLIAAGEPSWLEVQSRDGETLFRGSLEGRRSFPIGSGLQVLAGRPDLVQVQRGGGRPEAMGTIEDVRPRVYEAGNPPLTPPAR